MIVMESERARVEPEDYPRIYEMKVDGFDSRRALEHLLLDFQAKGHESNIK